MIRGNSMHLVMLESFAQKDFSTHMIVSIRSRIPSDSRSKKMGNTSLSKDMNSKRRKFVEVAKIENVSQRIIVIS